MSNKFLIALSLVFLVASCKTIDTQNRFEEEPDDIEEFVIEEQPQDEGEFEIIDEDAAESINEEITQEIEEVEVPDRVFFGYDKYSLTSDAKSILDVQTEWLQSDDSIKVVVEGHCDERGTREYNIALGERRALSVKKYLVSKGINSSRIRTISFGKERPAFVGTGNAIWSKNRRAVTIIED
jgi:peptidoglycan-associated lipoprotein